MICLRNVRDGPNPCVPCAKSETDYADRKFEEEEEKWRALEDGNSSTNSEVDATLAQALKDQHHGAPVGTVRI